MLFGGSELRCDFDSGTFDFRLIFLLDPIFYGLGVIYTLESERNRKLVSMYNFTKKLSPLEFGQDKIQKCLLVLYNLSTNLGKRYPGI